MRRIVQFLGFGILFLLLLFPGAGLLNSETGFQNSIITGIPAREAFRLFTDTSVMKQWINGLVRVEFPEGEMNAPGTKWKLIMKQDGKDFEITGSVTVFEPDRHLACKFERDILEGELDVRFTPSMQGTIITSATELHGKNLWCRSLLVLGRSRLRNRSQDMYETLKLIMEQRQVPA